jgi:hypothetical protein
MEQRARGPHYRAITGRLLDLGTQLDGQRFEERRSRLQFEQACELDDRGHRSVAQ